MKIYLVIALCFIVNQLKAETCTANIKDRNTGFIYESINHVGYGSKQQICFEAMNQCQNTLRNNQGNGQYDNADCVVEDLQYPDPRQGVVCQTDLVDFYGRVVRSFTAPGAGAYDACRTSDRFCQEELYRHTSYGSLCVNRGVIPNRNYPRPPQERNKVERCTFNRLDPAGMFIQSYTSEAQGPIYSDVKSIACNQAYSSCSMDLRGRQTCQFSQ